MAMIDIVLLIIFFGFVVSGFWFGLVHILGNLIGVVFGILAASYLYKDLSPFLQFLFLKEPIANWLAFIIIFVLVNRLVGFAVRMIDKGFKIFKIIPFISSINRLGGGLLSFVEAALVLGTILYVGTKFLGDMPLVQTIQNSAFAGVLIKIAKILLPLIPDSIKYLQNIMP